MACNAELMQQLQLRAAQLRQDVVRCVGVDYPGHIGGAFSAADIVAALYFHWMKHDPADASMPLRDRFILSKGHAAILQYAALARAGYFSADELSDTKKLHSRLQGHPDISKSPGIGIEACTGSLGQGLSIGVGMALGLRMDDIPARVYVLLGDGELAEGQNWEAAMAAARFGLGNLVAIIDKNGKQAQGSVSGRFDQGMLTEKWQAFGFHAIEIDGHCFCDILGALTEASAATDRPTAIIARTIKGKGLDYMENHPTGFHNFALSRQQYDSALAALGGAI